jgi:hypothetical protein
MSNWMLTRGLYNGQFALHKGNDLEIGGLVSVPRNYLEVRVPLAATISSTLNKHATSTRHINGYASCNDRFKHSRIPLTQYRQKTIHN